MSIRMRVTRGHTGNRRSHHKIKEPRLSKCTNCGAYHLRHRVCQECGHYKGKQIVDVLAKVEKKLEKAKKKAAAQNEEAENLTQEEKEKTEEVKESQDSNKESKE